MSNVCRLIWFALVGFFHSQAPWEVETLALRRQTLLGAPVACLLVLTAVAGPAAASDEAARTEIRAALTQWMADFNTGNRQKICDLFAPDLRADFRGQPERGYSALCDLLQRSLNDRSRAYSYSLLIKEILVWGDTAVVRLVWTLTIREKDREITSVEPGMDIFRRQPDGTWKITRYIAYEQ